MRASKKLDGSGIEFVGGSDGVRLWEPGPKSGMRGKFGTVVPGGSGIGPSYSSTPRKVSGLSITTK